MLTRDLFAVANLLVVNGRTAFGYFQRNSIYVRHQELRVGLCLTRPDTASDINRVIQMPCTFNFTVDTNCALYKTACLLLTIIELIDNYYSYDVLSTTFPTAHCGHVACCKSKQQQVGL